MWLRFIFLGLVWPVLTGCQFFDPIDFLEGVGVRPAYTEAVGTAEYIGSGAYHPYGYYRFRTDADTLILVSYSNMFDHDSVQTHNIGLTNGLVSYDIDVTRGDDTTLVVFQSRFPREIRVHHGQQFGEVMSTDVVSIRCNGAVLPSGFDNSEAVLLIGNSIMNGLGSAEPQLNSYVKRLMDRRLLTDFYTYGYSGAISEILGNEDLRSLIETLRNDYDQLTITVHLGVNDIVIHDDLENAVLNLQEFLDAVVPTRVLVLELLDIHGDFSYAQPGLDAFNASLDTLCTGHCGVITTEQVQEQDIMDGIHPNNRGHAKLFQAIHQRL